MSGTIEKAGFPTAKTSAGKPTLICLNPDGSVPVSSEPPGVCFKTPYACITLTETAQVPDEVDVGEFTAALAKVYACWEWSVSSNVGTIWSIYHIDDAGVTDTETLIHQWLTNPAHPNDCCKLDCLDFDTTGKTGVQKFVLRAEAIDWECLGPALGFAASREQP